MVKPQCIGGIGRDLEIRDGQIGKCHSYEGDCSFIIGKEYTLILYIWILVLGSRGFLSPSFGAIK